jgi:hypothetical protein
VAPLASIQSAFALDTALATGGEAALLCRYGEGLDQDGTLARTLVAARGLLDRTGEMPAAYIGEALKALVMHEIGHTLGLRHNFRGSAGATAEQLADRSWTAEHGHGVSVMDYSPPALATDPRRQASFYSPTVGSYDRWAQGGPDAAPRPARPGHDRARQGLVHGARSPHVPALQGDHP